MRMRCLRVGMWARFSDALHGFQERKGLNQLIMVGFSYET